MPQAARYLLPVYNLVYPAVWPNLGLHLAALTKLALLIHEDDEVRWAKVEVETEATKPGAVSCKVGMDTSAGNIGLGSASVLASEALEAARSAVSMLEVTHGGRRGIGLDAGPGVLNQAEYSLAEAQALYRKPIIS